MSEARVLVMAGSLRRDSLNHRLATVVAQALSRRQASVRLLRMSEFPMPVYDGDLEDRDGLPSGAIALRQAMQAHDAFVFCCPEYNASIPGAFKNALDWVSRPHAEESGLLPFKQKTVALMSASPGALGGLRSLSHVRAILSHVGCLVLPDQFGLPKADQAFDSDGGLLSERHQQRVDAITGRLLEVAGALRA